MKRLFAYFANIAISASCFAQANSLATRAYCDHNVSIAASQAQSLFQTNIPHIVDQVTDQVVDGIAPAITNVVSDIVGDLTITNVYEGYAEFAYIALTNSFLQGSFDNADVMSFGQPSIAFGINCKPYFNISLAAGTNSYSTGEIAFAFGTDCIAGYSSFAFGNDTHAENVGFAIGDGTSATGATSSTTGMFASGYRTTASGQGSHAEGAQTISSGSYSHAEGNQSTASGTTAHAEGFKCIASGTSAHADGYNAIASNSYSYVWNGRRDLQDSTYGSHGNYTYNINPRGGISGFYIGEENLETIISNIVLSIIASQQ